MDLNQQTYLTLITKELIKRKLQGNIYFILA